MAYKILTENESVGKSLPTLFTTKQLETNGISERLN